MTLSLFEGNETLAWGAYRMGCIFFAGYPIIPATYIFNPTLSIPETVKEPVKSETIQDNN